MVGGAREFTFEPDVDGHGDEFPEIVVAVVVVEWALGRDEDSPGAARSHGAAAKADGAGVGEADAGGVSDGEQVEGNAGLRFLQKDKPELEVKQGLGWEGCGAMGRLKGSKATEKVAG